MRYIIIAAVIALLAGCGADTMTAAATAAALKKQEVEQGKKTMAQMQQRIGAMSKQMQQSADKIGEASDNQ